LSDGQKKKYIEMFGSFKEPIASYTAISIEFGTKAAERIS